MRQQTIEAHYRARWPGPAGMLGWKVGPVHELPSDFGVLFVQRNEMTAYATVCMSQPEDEYPLELHLLSQGELQGELVELMYMVAHFHRTGARLWLGHTVRFGRPWLPGSECTCGLISLPYLDGPKLEWMGQIRFLWLIPITEAEREYKIEHGLEALETRFEETQFNYLHPLRPSVV